MSTREAVNPQGYGRSPWANWWRFDQRRDETVTGRPFPGIEGWATRFNAESPPDRTTDVQDEHLRIQVELPQTAEVREVTAAVAEIYPDIELVS